MSEVKEVLKREEQHKKDMERKVWTVICSIICNYYNSALKETKCLEHSVCY